ncbi:MAG: SpoIIE family protein phosphatase [Bryobacteraceae bacterium]|jgi:sigma-B regulation protein RsbU (phosphoserine phosphatase)
MAPGESPLFRPQLLDRRRRLETARTAQPASHELERLLAEVDAALDRVAGGTFGLCESCHDPIETERLAADPLTRFCIEHLNESERRALERDLELAIQIQASLLPQRQFQAGEWETWYHYDPAGPVSGDYCDLMPAGAAGLFFFAGDVAGKGVAAALLMSHLHAIFRSLVQFGLSVEEMIGRANRVFCESTGSAEYATLLCGHAGAAGAIEVANAGHCPPLWIRREGAEALEANGVPLGMFCSVQYPAHRVALEPGDRLVLYTDGLTEARDGSDCEYGQERLSSVLARCHGLPAQAIAERALTDLRQFLSGARPTDDLTLLVIGRGAAA